MHSEPRPSRTKSLILGIGAVVILGLAACSHHNNNNGNTTTPVNNTANNMTNNTTSENATAEVFGAGFATDFSGNANTDPANVSTADVTPVSATADPVAVNSTGAVNTTGEPQG